MNALDRVPCFSKKTNLDNLVRALNFLYAFKHLVKICSSDFNSLSILTPRSFTLLLSHILSSPILSNIHVHIF